MTEPPQNMAVFEKERHRNASLDDTTSLYCTVETAQSMGDHVEYTLKIQRGLAGDKAWSLQKRYSDFVQLDTNLAISGMQLPIPPKKVFGNFDREFVAERKQGLQNYINAVLAQPFLANSIFTKRFLDENNYSGNWQELALQQVSMFFRSEPRWEVLEPLPDIGWRLRKRYFLIHPMDVPKQRQLLAWSEHGPDRYLSDKDVSAIMKLLPSFGHPYLYPIECGYANDTGGLAIRNLFEKGTLRDLICKAKPKTHYLKKYGMPKAIVNLPVNLIKLLGKQILDILKYLHDKSFPYGHLHACNVIVTQDNKVKLLDIENSLLGLACEHRPFIVEFKKIQTLELVDVYCFGHVLFEMTFGRPLRSPTFDTFPPQCPAEIRSVLESILTMEACKNGLPTVEDLLLHPLFSDVVLPAAEQKPTIKIPSKLKEAIRSAKEQTEKRLKEDQKVIHVIRRRSKAASHHMSEEEKKKRRKSKKKSTAEDTDQSATQSAVPSTNSSNQTTENRPSTPTTSGPAPPAPPPVPVAASVLSVPEGRASPAPAAERSALLGSISNFSKTGLNKTETVDKSEPIT